MSDILANEVVKVVAKMTDVNGSLIENVFHYLNSTGSTVDDATFLTDIEDELSEEYAIIEGSMPDTLTPLEIECDVVAFSGGELQTVHPVGTIAWTTWSGGTATGDGLPQGAASQINFPTGSPGVQGRKYFGPLAEAVQNNGNLSSSAQTNLATMAVDFLLGVSGTWGTMFPVVMSQKYGAAVGLASAVVREVVAYQRRRKSGRGA